MRNYNKTMDNKLKNILVLLMTFCSLVSPFALMITVGAWGIFSIALLGRSLFE